MSYLCFLPENKDENFFEDQVVQRDFLLFLAPSLSEDLFSEFKLFKTTADPPELQKSTSLRCDLRMTKLFLNGGSLYITQLRVEPPSSSCSSSEILLSLVTTCHQPPHRGTVVRRRSCCEEDGCVNTRPRRLRMVGGAYTSCSPAFPGWIVGGEGYHSFRSGPATTILRDDIIFLRLLKEFI